MFAYYYFFGGIYYNHINDKTVHIFEYEYCWGIKIYHIYFISYECIIKGKAELNLD